MSVQLRHGDCRSSHVGTHQGTIPSRSWKVPVRPFLGSVARRTIASVPSLTVWVPRLLLKSVAVKPGRPRSPGCRQSPRVLHGKHRQRRLGSRVDRERHRVLSSQSCCSSPTGWSTTLTRLGRVAGSLRWPSRMQHRAAVPRPGSSSAAATISHRRTRTPPPPRSRSILTSMKSASLTAHRANSSSAESCP